MPAAAACMCVATSALPPRSSVHARRHAPLLSPCLHPVCHAFSAAAMQRTSASSSATEKPLDTDSGAKVKSLETRLATAKR